MIKKTAFSILLKSLSYGLEKARCHHIKLFYLSMYCMLFAGCGKKVKGLEEEIDVRRETLTSDSIVLKDHYSPSGIEFLSKSQYDFANDSSVRIPASISVNEGNAGNNTAVIYFNAQSANDFGFYCKYIGGASTASPITQTEITNGLFYNFETCYTQANDQAEVNYYPGYEAIQFGNSSIILELLSADPLKETHATTEFEVNWR